MNYENAVYASCRILTHTDRDSDDKAGTLQVISQLVKTTMDLPPRIQAICWAQFWAWIGTVPLYSQTNFPVRMY